jgi:hypothetical protein
MNIGLALWQDRCLRFQICRSLAQRETCDLRYALYVLGFRPLENWQPTASVFVLDRTICVSLTSMLYRQIKRSKGKHVFGASSMFTRFGGECDLATDRHSIP